MPPFDLLSSPVSVRSMQPQSDYDNDCLPVPSYVSITLSLRQNSVRNNGMENVSYVRSTSRYKPVPTRHPSTPSYASC